jgi:hypothetical protein
MSANYRLFFLVFGDLANWFDNFLVEILPHTILSVFDFLYIIIICRLLKYRKRVYCSLFVLVLDNSFRLLDLFSLPYI